MSLFRTIPAALMAPLLIPGITLAQQGDRAGETQPPLPPTLQIPQSPPLSLADSLSSFKVPEGLKVQLVAAEPDVIAPVMSTFGPDGRLWVVEMPGYMSDLDGTRELEPNGRIVVLTDTDRDGRMDDRTVFLDELVLPRAMAVVEDGILVAAPPNLIHARDLDGDNHADETTILDSSFGGLESPEHAGNGLRYGLDNWLHCSQHSWEYRFNRGELARRAVPPHGQWGTTSDAWGQWYYTPNSYPLLMDLLPKHVVSMNRAQRDHSGVYEHLPADQSVHSIRINPGVNRAYRSNTLNDDFTLSQFTAACGPTIYLDSVLGDTYEGDVFICEPAGNTVEHRNLVHRAEHLTPELRTDPDIGAIIASSDERFRPVHAETGPDGGLYITDMYRGILQHKIFMTTFLRRQIEERRLDTPIDMGRIWRIVPDDDVTRTPTDLTALDDHELVEQLDAVNGVVRRLAQQQLVNRTDLSKPALDRLESMAGSSDSQFGRIHALWTLHGRESLSSSLLVSAMEDADARIRHQAYRMAADHLGSARVLDQVLIGLDDPSVSCRRQAAASLAATDASTILTELADALNETPADQVLRTAVVAGSSGNEIDLLSELVWRDQWVEQDDARAQLARSLVMTTLRQKDPTLNLKLLELLAALPEDQQWLTAVMAQPIIEAQKLRSAQPRSLKVSAAPFDWDSRLGESPGLADGLLHLIDAHSTWPGRAGYEPNVDVTGLKPHEAKMLQHGSMLYTHCTGCHQADGLGLRGFYPPLADSPFVTGGVEPLLAILIKGMDGPVEIEGLLYDQPMPPAPFTSNEDLAAIAFFIRRSFDNKASFVSPEDVSRTREQLIDHDGPVTTEDLRKRWP